MVNKPIVFKPHSVGMEYAGDFPDHFKHSWMVEFKGFSIFYAAKPTRKQVRALVDFVNVYGG